MALLAAGLAGAPAAAAQDQSVRDRDVYARVTAGEVVLGNAVAERRWSRSGLRTTALVDKRGGGRTWSAGARDFTLHIGSTEVGSEAFSVGSVDVAHLPRGGLRVTMRLSGPGLTATRVAEAYPGVAGFRTQTTLQSPVALALTGATLDEAAAGPGVPTVHAFRAGADWREPGWKGPDVTVGDPHAGTWRDTRSAGRGQALEAPAQWLSLADGDRSLFLVLERVDFPSSRMAYDGRAARARVEYPRDVISLGPFEEQGHVEGFSPTAGRQRTLRPGVPFPLEAVFVGFGHGDGDEVWQHHRYLVGHRLLQYPKAVTFNSNGTDDNRISTGAKDDMDLATVEQVAPIARRLGIETFILDDGWQAISGDWQPDSPQFPEPRWDGNPQSKFRPRFPDPRFEAVRRAIAPMRLGLWWTPGSFHPSARTYREHPDWACTPVGQGTAGLGILDPNSGSNEAGIGIWNARAFPHVEARLREAIQAWGVRYFKFDFLVWLDCAGEGDLYEMHDAFVAMLDRLQAAHPDVTFQVDETNDYRTFPFESTARGPAWFQNGTPEPDRLLHNLWNLSPWVPAFSLGQHFLGGRQWERHPVATLMAVALPSHLTVFSDLRQIPARVIEEAAPWVRFYRRHRGDLAQVTYPLLDDPLRKSWTALQSWDPDRGRGALLAFRQESADPTRRIGLRNVPDGRRFDLLRAPDERYVDTFTSAELRRGVDVRIADRRGAEVLLVLPAQRVRAALRVRCARARRRATATGSDGTPLRRVRFRVGRRTLVDGRAPFRRTLPARGRRVTAELRFADGREARVSRRAPACASERRPATRRRATSRPRFTG